MLSTSRRVWGSVLFANLHLLFWLSLFPFTTARMSESYLAVWPTVAYGVVLLMAAMAYATFQRTLIVAEGAGSVMRRAIGSDWKGKLSPAFYLTDIAPASMVGTVVVRVGSLVLVGSRPWHRRQADQPCR